MRVFTFFAYQKPVPYEPVAKTMKKKHLSFLLFLMCCIPGFSVFAQNKITTFGMFLRPSFPNQFFRTGPIDFSDRGIDYSIVQQSGISFGGIIRKGFTKRLSFETGIVYTKRNYNLTLTDSTFTGKGEYSIIGYEIPLTALVFIQLGEQLWMNVGLGPGVEFYPSDIYTDDSFYAHYGAREQTFNGAINASLGFELRTKKSGYFYLGFNYHRSFSPIYTSVVEYYPSRDFSIPYTSIGRTQLQGDYFGIDLRYFFHEDPEKKKKKVTGRN